MHNDPWSTTGPSTCGLRTKLRKPRPPESAKEKTLRALRDFVSITIPGKPETDKTARIKGKS